LMPRARRRVAPPFRCAIVADAEREAQTTSPVFTLRHVHQLISPPRPQPPPPRRADAATLITPRRRGFFPRYAAFTFIATTPHCRLSFLLLHFHLSFLFSQRCRCHAALMRR
jgi:hypothetical protein